MESWQKWKEENLLECVVGKKNLFSMKNFKNLVAMELHMCEHSWFLDSLTLGLICLFQILISLPGILRFYL